MRYCCRSLFVLMLVIAVGFGCRSRERRPNGFFTRPAQPAQPQLPLGGGSQPFVPPAPAPTGPSPGLNVNPANPATPVPSTNVPPPPSFPSDSRFGGGGNQQADYRWQPSNPSDAQIRLLAPQPDSSRSDTPDVNPPQISERRKSDPTDLRPSTDGSGKDDGQELSLPVGIPQFSIVKPNVTAGLRPSLDEGLDWLKRKGYRTVLYLRSRDEVFDADQKQVEKRGMRFETIEVSANTLSKKTLEDFTKIVTKTDNHPLFVYDRDGSLSGGLWYLYFRTVEHTSHDAATLRSGLRQETDDAHRIIWLAIQQYLKDNPQ